jgi:hypothetical protein
VNRRDARARIERVEALAGIHGPLGLSEAAELRRLELDRAARFAGDVDDWTDDQVEDYLEYQTGQEAARLGHLRERALPPAEQARQRALAIALEAMDDSQLDEWMAETSRATQEGNP